jgi:hypothetical protein
LGNWIPSKFLNFIEDNQFVEFRINGSIDVSAETRVLIDVSAETRFSIEVSVETGVQSFSLRIVGVRCLPVMRVRSLDSFNVLV